MVKKIILWTIWIVAVPVVVCGVLLLYVTVADYKPPAKQDLLAERNTGPELRVGVPFTVTTFNIGYAGLDRAQDFFMDGGTMSRSSSKMQTEANLDAFVGFMDKHRSDIYLLQEVDRKASRSYKVDEVRRVQESLPEYSAIFALNYKVPWVPVPVFRPMGSVQSGLLTLSKYRSIANTRYDLPGKEKWPVQLFELDRAMIESRYALDNGKELVVVNLHLSAFDKGGEIRKVQLEFLSAYITEEVDKGNYMIVGGDWNHALPGTDSAAFPATQGWPEWLQPFPEGFAPDGFVWGVDPGTPTVRTLDTAYYEGVNFLAVIDGFLVSPNVEVVEVTGTSLGFENSDHNPVTGKFILR